MIAYYATEIQKILPVSPAMYIPFRFLTSITDPKESHAGLQPTPTGACEAC